MNLFQNLPFLKMDVFALITSLSPSDISIMFVSAVGILARWFLFWGAVLWALTLFSSIPGSYLLCANSTPTPIRWDNQKCLQSFPNDSLLPKSLPVENYWSRVYLCSVDLFFKTYFLSVNFLHACWNLVCKIYSLTLCSLGFFQSLSVAPLPQIQNQVLHRWFGFLSHGNFKDIIDSQILVKVCFFYLPGIQLWQAIASESCM